MILSSRTTQNKPPQTSNHATFSKSIDGGFFGRKNFINSHVSPKSLQTTIGQNSGLDRKRKKDKTKQLVEKAMSFIKADLKEVHSESVKLTKYGYRVDA